MSNIVFYSELIGKKSGVQKAAIDIIVSILANGHTLTVVTTSPRCPLPTQSGGVNRGALGWVQVPRRVTLASFRGNIFRRFAAMTVQILRGVLLKKNESVLKTIAADLVFVNSSGGDDLYMRYKDRVPSAKKEVFISHGSVGQYAYSGYGKYRPVAAAKRIAAYSAAVFVSKNTIEDWIALADLDPQHCHYIPNCIDEKDVEEVQKRTKSAVRKDLGLPVDRFIVTCIASIQYMKGQDLLINSIEGFSEIEPNLSVLLIGRIKDKWGSELVNSLDRRGNGGIIQVLGFRPNPLDYVYASDLIILPSRGEALPLAILEAMALDTPVLASSVDGIPELIEHEKEGFLFPKDDAEQMLAGFSALVNDPGLRQRFTIEARSKYWSEFSRELQIQRYGRLIADYTADLSPDHGPSSR